MPNKAIRVVAQTTALSVHESQAPHLSSVFKTNSTCPKSHTLEMIRRVLGNEHLTHRTSFQNQLKHWKRIVSTQCNHIISFKALSVYFAKWIDLNTQCSQKRLMSCEALSYVRHAEQTLDYLSKSNKQSSTLDLFYLIFIHTPLLPDAAHRIAHGLFLKIKHTRTLDQQNSTLSTTPKEHRMLPYMLAALSSTLTSFAYYTLLNSLIDPPSSL